MNTSEMNTNLTIRINKKMMNRLKKQAKNEGRNFSEILRDIIQKYLEAHND